jgi:predicted neutral ceramidase superfamily lipid hydrolase
LPKSEKVIVVTIAPHSLLQIAKTRKKREEEMRHTQNHEMAVVAACLTTVFIRWTIIATITLQIASLICAICLMSLQIANVAELYHTTPSSLLPTIQRVICYLMFDLQCLDDVAIAFTEI